MTDEFNDYPPDTKGGSISIIMNETTPADLKVSIKDKNKETVAHLP